LRKHKGVVRRLVDKGIALGKGKLTVQRGSFLLPLLTATLSALTSLIQVWTCYQDVARITRVL
jgi:hypothetical protein